ncbi:hypothetical protein [Malikia granosa]|nr:hypothetical protein [Malikia granosa]
MSMALQSLMLTFEVTLRNRIHISLSRQATEGTTNPVDSFAWYDHRLGMHKLEGETYRKVERILCDEQDVRLPTQPTPDRVIARLSFGVWPNILEQQLPTPVVQARTFLDVFPHYPRKPKHYWKHAENRKIAVDKVKDVKGWRNRIAHCKPVWTEGWYRCSQAQHWTEVLDRVKGRRSEMLEVLGWMCPQTVEVYKMSYSGRLFDALVTEQAVLAHICQPHVPAIGPIYPEADIEAMKAYKAR